MRSIPFQICIKGEIMASETINFAVTVSAAANQLTLTDPNGNVLTDGESVTLPDLAVGTAANEELFVVSGGTAPYNFSVGSGAVPDGTSLNSTVNADNTETVTLEGTPTTAQTSDFSITVTDSAGASTKLTAKKKIR
jgi:hypothetical protein